MMRRILIDNALSRRFRHSQRGQSIVLLAFAFIALVAFVGLVTDVALMFVRYASLRRAVDAAAIAAAGQIREGTDYGEIAIAADQYIALHNLDADSVLVETCETDIYQWRSGTGPWESEGPHTEAAYPSVPASMPETELCDWDDPRKLVRVSAQVESPTTFLSLIGIDSFTLEATSVSETAVLDVALVIDTSQSMAKETDLSDYMAIGIQTPVTGYPADGVGLHIRGECYTEDDEVIDGWAVPALGKERWAGCCNDPGTGQVGDGSRQSNNIIVPNGLIWHDTNGDGLYSGPGENGVSSSAAQSSPGDPNYTTLICMPFKEVKDAGRLFIKQLDFVRGDRAVLVTFDRNGVAYDPDGSDPTFRPMIRSEAVAIQTLNLKMGVMINDTGVHDRCGPLVDAITEWNIWIGAGSPEPEPEFRPYAYESLAACGNTNLGGGILAANNALVDPVDIRREAVWVMIVLSDGAANVTNPTDDAASLTDYGAWGYCPWWSFCILDTDSPYHWSECVENNPAQLEVSAPFCNDNDPLTRHFCIDWNTGEAEVGNLACGSTGHYDADDYARDMADFAGLIELTPGGKRGNFIAMFSIGFGEEVVDEETAAPLLRYVADAGDNGFIDNNLQQDLREDRNTVPSYPIGGPYPPDYGEPDVCESVIDATENCGQYYYAADKATLISVFEEIASRLFTRLSR